MGGLIAAGIGGGIVAASFAYGWFGSRIRYGAPRRAVRGGAPCLAIDNDPKPRRTDPAVQRLRELIFLDEKARRGA